MLLPSGILVCNLSKIHFKTLLILYIISFKYKIVYIYIIEYQKYYSYIFIVRHNGRYFKNELRYYFNLIRWKKSTFTFSVCKFDLNLLLIKSALLNNASSGSGITFSVSLFSLIMTWQEIWCFSSRFSIILTQNSDSSLQLKFIAMK